jgi:hypothetical protein
MALLCPDAITCRPAYVESDGNMIGMASEHVQLHAIASNAGLKYSC